MSASIGSRPAGSGVLSARPAHVLVTGGSSGIGAAVVRLCVHNGCAVTNLDRVAPVADIAGCEFIETNVADSTAVDASVRAATERHGRIGGLVAVAGVGNLKLLDDYSDREFMRLIDVNLTGVFNVVRAAMDELRQSRGAVVTVASASGERPSFGEAPYSAAKAAVVSLTRSIAAEFGPEVRANCVSPGLIRTPMSEMVADDPAILERIPARRAGTPDEVAALVDFLLSDAAGYITGQNIVIDGGALLPQHSTQELLQGLVVGDGVGG